MKKLKVHLTNIRYDIDDSDAFDYLVNQRVELKAPTAVVHDEDIEAARQDLINSLPKEMEVTIGIETNNPNEDLRRAEFIVDSTMWDAYIENITNFIVKDYEYSYEVVV